MVHGLVVSETQHQIRLDHSFLDDEICEFSNYVAVEA